MAGKTPRTITEQIQLLQSRGMLFRDINNAPHFLANISYYRLKGYWWEMQGDKVNHHFAPHSYFEDVIDLYNFDRHFRLIVFNAIERIEIALRTKLIYHLSLQYGNCWYINQSMFTDKVKHADFLSKLHREMKSSKEEFMESHYKNHKNDYPEAWKALEVVTLGTLSKIYDNLHHQSPAKSKIANEFGLTSSSDFSSWLRSITLARNIVAHHSRLWNKVLIMQYSWPKNMETILLDFTPNQKHLKKIFPLLVGMIYLNDKISPGHSLKKELVDLIQQFPNVPFYKMGFPRYWQNQPIFIE